jgi:hypothetical protein
MVLCAEKANTGTDKQDNQRLAYPSDHSNMDR